MSKETIAAARAEVNALLEGLRSALNSSLKDSTANINIIDSIDEDFNDAKRMFSGSEKVLRKVDEEEKAFDFFLDQLDVKKKQILENVKRDCCIYQEKLDAVSDRIDELQDAGVGEIVINSIDRDGTKTGYDFELIEKIIHHIKVPMTIIGGVGSFDDFKSAIERYGIIGISAGSLFVYQGRYDAVLINFLSNEEKNELASISTKFYRSHMS